MSIIEEALLRLEPRDEEPKKPAAEDAPAVTEPLAEHDAVSEPRISLSPGLGEIPAQNNKRDYVIVLGLLGLIAGGAGLFFFGGDFFVGPQQVESRQEEPSANIANVAARSGQDEGKKGADVAMPPAARQAGASGEKEKGKTVTIAAGNTNTPVKRAVTGSKPASRQSAAKAPAPGSHQRPSAPEQDMTALPKPAATPLQTNSPSAVADQENDFDEAAAAVLAALDDRRPVEAMRLAGALAARHPNRIEPRLWLGRARLMAGDAVGAESELARVCEAAPHLAEAWLIRGIAAQERAAHEEAVAFLGESLKLSPKNPTARFNLAFSLDALGRTDEARAQWQNFLEQTRGDARYAALRAHATARLTEAPASRALNP